MCTVIYYPCTDGALFSSCRDEDPARAAASLPRLHKRDNTIAVFPKDAAAGGTWAGISQEGNLVILLNGAFEKHTRQNEYRKSRGLIVKDLLFVADPVKEWDDYDLQNVEPFTLVIWNQKKLYEAVWDGGQKHTTPYDSTVPHIWSSSTLYDQAAKALRRQWFNKRVQNNDISDIQSLRSFLLAHKEPQNGFVMQRNQQIATLSITCFQLNNDQFTIHHNDLISKEEEEIKLFTKANIIH